jgi:exonuclease III
VTNPVTDPARPPAPHEPTWRLLAWNIRHGGGPARTPEIALALAQAAPDAVILTEFRAHRGGQLRPVLADVGLTHHLVATAPQGANTIFIASRQPLTPAPTPPVPGRPGRFLAANLAGLTLAAAHVPDDTDPAAKASFWQFLLALARAPMGERLLIAGDFNTARRGIDTDGVGARAAPLLGTLVSLGFVDAWRAVHPGEREDTWTDGRASARLDAAFLAPALAPRLVGARHLRVWMAEGLSDHAPLEVALRCPDEGEPRPRTTLFS